MSEIKRVVLITGASSGIGRACAEYLHQRGHRVYGASRRAQSAPFTTIQMDVDRDLSVKQGVDLVLKNEARLDVVVNSAGFALAGSIEDTSITEARSQLETNFFGALRVCRAALPVMKAQRFGYIVNISSLGGLIGLPFQGLYSASKFALEGMSEALRMEARLLGIRVVLVEPGNFSTQLTSNRQRAAQSRQNPAYLEEFTHALAVVEADEMRGASPEKIASLIERIIRDPSPRLRYTTGPVLERAAVALKKVLPPRLFEWGVMKYYRLLL
jgi:NAD(P)-dependent dehydrogenase (short-subunit alcohol dehydrogenase family)